MANVAEILATTPRLIDSLYESINQPRTRLGLSQAGHKCGRYLWYAHHGYEGDTPDGRVLRLFELGNVVEDIVIDDLQYAGISCFCQQREVLFEMNGITLRGHIDGIVRGLVEAPKTDHLFECKTASLKRYKELLKKGYKDWSQVYYWQLQFYMLGLGLKRAAAFVYCKDDSRLYMERVKLDKTATIDKLADVFSVIAQTCPPVRECPDVDFFEAKFCRFRRECWRLKK